MLCYTAVWVIEQYRAKKFSPATVVSVFETQLATQLQIADSIWNLDKNLQNPVKVSELQSDHLIVIKLHNRKPADWNSDLFSYHDINSLLMQNEPLVRLSNTHYYLKKNSYHYGEGNTDTITYLFVIPLINLDNSDSKVLISKKLDENLIAHNINIKGPGQLAHAITVNGVALMSIDFLSANYILPHEGQILFYALAILLIVVCIHAFALKLLQNHLHLSWITELLLFTALYLTVHNVQTIPETFTNNILFSPKILSSNYLFSHLFRLSVFVLLLVFFCNLGLRICFNNQKGIPKSNNVFINLLISWACTSLLLYTITETNTLIYSSLIFDSKISFVSDNLQHLNFTSILAMFILVILCVNSIVIMQTISLYNQILKFKPIFHTLQTLLIIFIIAAIQYHKTTDFMVIATAIFCSISYVLLFYIDFNLYSLLPRKIKRIKWQIWMLVICVFCTITITVYYYQKEVAFRTFYAENCFKNNNSKFEFYFAEKLAAIKNDSELQNMISNELNPQFFANHLLFNYFSKLESEITISASLIDKDHSPYQTDTLLFQQALDNPYLYQAYLVYPQKTVQLNITQNDLFHYKKYKREGTIIGENTYSDYLFYARYHTAKYVNGKLIEHDGMEEFNAVLPLAIQKDLAASAENKIIIDNATTSNLLLSNNNNEVIWVKYMRILPLQIINTFNSVILSTLLLLGIYLLLRLLFAQKNPNLKLFKKSFHLDVNTKLNVALLATLFISFSILGLTVVYFISSSEKTNTSNKNYKNIGIAKLIAEEHLLRPQNKLQTEELISNLNMAAHLYDDKGVLITELDAYLNSQSLINKYLIHPSVLKELKNKNGDFFFNTTKNNFYNFSNLYAPIYINNNKYIINIYDYSSLTLMTENKGDILLSILNLFILIGFLASILSYFITSNALKPIKIIIQKLKKISLKHNETIEGHQNDEFAPLINEYNKMILKVESLAQKLSIQERNLLWKEFAQQVAHEVKNPLTPMRLNIQYLQRAIAENRPNKDALTEKVCNIILEQIDNLNHIASEFSTLAKLDEAHPTIFNLNDTLEKLVQLFRAEESITIEYRIQNTRIEVQMDKSYFIRSVTNILKNAIQAFLPDQEKLLQITCKVSGNNVQIAIKDNGPGIPEHMKEKIFTPYFTSKSTGTGIGLSMTKNMIEMSNGYVTFETSETNGTIFFIKLPIYNAKELN